MKVSTVIGTVRSSYLTIWIHSIFISFLGLAPFLYMMQVQERVYTSRSWETFGFITALVWFLILVWGVLEYYRSSALRALGYKIDHELRGHVFDAVHRGGRPDAFRAYGDISTLRSGLTGSFVETAFDATLAPIFIGVLFLLHPVFGWVAIVYIILIALLSHQARSLWRNVQTAGRVHEDKAFAFGLATATKSDVVRAMNILPGIRREWTALQNQAADTFMQGQSRASRIEVVIDILQHGQIVLIVGVGAALFLNDAVTPGAGMAAFIVMMRGVGPVLAVAKNWPMIHEIRSAAERLEKVLEDDVSEPESPLPDMQGHVECDNLGVLGADGKPILSGIRFSVPAGAVVGVIGPSGAGKSTLLRLLAGAARPSTGAVKVDGFPIDLWPAAQRGGDIGYLPQNVALMPGTVWQNVARFAPFETKINEEVFAALRMAGAMDILQSKNRGLDFPLLDEGAPLSGGQRQRIGLARAFFRNPKLLVLDEPNSALDAEGEKNLLYSIAELKRAGSTVFFSTHKLNMLSICDYILVLMDGYVHSFSTRDDILQRLTAAENPLITSVQKGKTA